MQGTSRSGGARSGSSSIPRGGKPGRTGAREAGDADRLAPCEARIKLRLPVDAESVAAAHRSVLDIAPALDRAELDDVRLMISELVTNAVRHAGLCPDDWIELEVAIGGNRIRVEVRDPGPGFDPAVIPASDPLEQAGWGLRLVDQVASRWGVDRIERGTRTCVWSELDLRPPAGRDRFTPKGHR